MAMNMEFGRTEGFQGDYMNANFELQGRKAIVTGGAKGIGKAAVKGLAEQYVDVALVDIDAQWAQKTVEEINAIGRGKVFFVSCDVTKPDAVKAMVQTVVEKFGRIDICFNNAGIAINQPAEEMSYENWMKLMDLNLNAVFLVAQAVGNVMIKQKSGSIINTASMSGRVVNFPQPQVGYNASKAAVMQLSKSMAVEWVRHNVRVNSLSPGYIYTEMTCLGKEEWRKVWEENCPMLRMGYPQELVGMLLYLSSDYASFLTGQDILIDGAFSAV